MSVPSAILAAACIACTEQRKLPCRSNKSITVMLIIRAIPWKLMLCHNCGVQPGQNQNHHAHQNHDI